MNDLYYEIRIPGLAKCFDVRLRFSLFNVEKQTKATFEWDWDDPNARKYVDVFEGSDDRDDEGWSLNGKLTPIAYSFVFISNHLPEETRVEPSELAMTALTTYSTAAPIITSVRTTPSIPFYTLDEQKSRKCKFDSNGMEIWNNTQTSDTPPVPFAVNGTEGFLTIAVCNPWSGLSNMPLNVLVILKARNGSTPSVWDYTIIDFKFH